MPKLNRHAAFCISTNQGDKSSFLLHYQFLCRIAEHDGINTFWQIAYIYSQSLNAGFEVERSYSSAVDVEDLKQGILLQCLELQCYEALRRVGLQCKLSCVHLLQR